MSGLWHGADMSFVVWGIIHGILIIIENISGILKKKSNFFFDFLRRVLCFLFVVFAFIFFRAKNIKEANIFIKNLFAFNLSWHLFFKDLEKSNFGYNNLAVLGISLFILFLVDLIKYNKIDPLKILQKVFLPLRWVLYFIIIFSILIFGIYGPGFSESQFIYFQF